MSQDECTRQMILDELQSMSFKLSKEEKKKNKNKKCKSKAQSLFLKDCLKSYSDCNLSSLASDSLASTSHSNSHEVTLQRLKELNYEVDLAIDEDHTSSSSCSSCCSFSFSPTTFHQETPESQKVEEMHGWLLYKMISTSSHEAGTTKVSAITKNIRIGIVSF